MKTKMLIATVVAVSFFKPAAARAQGDKVVADNLAYSREFYSGVHVVAIASFPVSFAYDRYPDNGPERIRCDSGTFARKQGKPWLKSNDWGESGQPASKEMARKFDGWVKLIDAAFNSVPAGIKLAKKSEEDGRVQWLFEARSPNPKGSPTKLRFAKPLYDNNESVLLHGFEASLKLEGDKVVPSTAANSVKLSFGYLVSVNGGEFELSERAWEDLDAPKDTPATEPKIGPNPKDAAGFQNRAGLRAHNGDMNGAIADYGRVIELDPKSAAAYWNRGALKREKRDFDGAIADLNLAIELNPNDHDYYNDRGIAKRGKGDNDGAIADYTKSIEIDPKNGELAFFNRALAKNSKNDKDGAVADYNKALELNPKNANAYNNRGNLKKDKNDLDGAISDFTKAIEINPKIALIYKNRADAKRKKGDPAGADADLKSAAELNSNSQ
ncbi:MAG TPA: tetratricopeptide repeat protein [Chthoniobacterales bacterium]|nr:tetratricopeptide repeat protein [Chthoniobacterales bacterium]